MRRALLVYSVNNWTFYMSGQKHLLKLVDANTDSYACTRLTAKVDKGEVSIAINDENDVFGDTKITFSGDYMIIWDGK